MPRSLARRAAQSHRTTSARGLLELLFAKTFDGLVYPQIWEDPEVDMAALELAPGARLVAIASGGCNVMSYLIADPARILAVDLSPAHLALLDLKRTAARLLDQEAFFGLFGDAADRRNLDSYMRLRKDLLPATRAYWEKRSLGGRRRIAAFTDGFYRTGVLGRCIGLGHRLVRLHGGRPERLLEARDLAAQRRIYEAELAPVFERALPRFLAQLPLAFFGLGIPPAQYEAMREDAEHGMMELVRERIERLACDFPITDNYFAWQAFGRRYDPAGGALPPYLRAAEFAKVSARAGVIEAELVPLTERLAREPAASLDAYVLLDAQDWMTPAQLTALWAEISRTAAPGARVVFRTAAEEPTAVEALPAALRASWRYERARSRALHARDRSAIYGGFHLYVRAA
jgi:S-adenosylmethionine-diacylglycerol 3-amino-3-carboxypropyl transferase